MRALAFLIGWAMSAAHGPLTLTEPADLATAAIGAARAAAEATAPPRNDARCLGGTLEKGCMVRARASPDCLANPLAKGCL